MLEAEHVQVNATIATVQQEIEMVIPKIPGVPLLKRFQGSLSQLCERAWALLCAGMMRYHS